MIYALGLLGFVVALLVSVMLHEAGHFLTARRYGMKATQFFVGFGPTLWSTRRGETEYGVKAVPAGGFVKIVGMTPLEEVEVGDEDRAFYKQSAGRKTVVLAAGSTVHFVLCVLIVLVTIVAFGVQRETAPRLAALSDCVSDDASVTYCGTPGAVAAPARAAGLKAGDVVEKVDGVSIGSASALTKAIRAAGTEPLSLQVSRDGTTRTVVVTPAAVLRDGKQAAAIGVGVGARYEWVRLGPVDTLQQTGTTVKLFVTGTWDTLTKKLGTITKVYSDDRDPAGFVGVVGVSRVSGEVAATDQLSLREKAVVFLGVVASLNLFVGVFNLLPLLPLDGGHIAVVWFEAARDRLRRARGYVGEVQRVDYNRLMPLTLAVVVLFASFTVFLLGADLVNPIRVTE